MSNNDHHTSSYNWSYPVYRRGNPIYINCSCENSESIESIQIQLKTGRATRGSGRKFMKLTMGYVVNGWTVRYQSTGYRSSITVVINSPANSIIGHYIGEIYINGRIRQHVKFLLFFNPWCPDDSVFMDDNDKRFEYVLNTHTIIYMGTWSHIVSHGWYLAQFQNYSIEAALLILDRMPADDRNSPIKVSRFFSALVNTNDDNGIVVGSWSGSYAGGTNPLSWTGSASILAKYVRQRIPVKYGQCWVFSGVLCSLLRTVGIPARCITTYNSFHDHDGSLVWEMYFSRNMRPLHFRRQETMWNFHCWNEAWMDRKDIPNGNSGWQIVDATPQERSQGIFRCGPAPKNAVKEGNVDFPYDTGFVFAEVNADKIFYFQRPNGQFVIGKIDSVTIGRAISSKAVGSNQREDLTLTYKYSDNSMTERIIQNKVQKIKRRSRTYKTSLISVDIFPPNHVSINEDCLINFKMKNSSKSSSHVKFRVVVSVISYRGRIHSILFNQKYETNIDGHSEKPFQEMIKSAKIKSSMINDMFSIKAEVNGMTNSQDFIYAESVFNLESPKINIYGAPTNLYTGNNYSLGISVMNPIDRPLTNVILFVNGEVIPFGIEKIYVNYIDVNQSYEGKFEVFSQNPGLYHIYASLQSNEISGFYSSVTVRFTD